MITRMDDRMQGTTQELRYAGWWRRAAAVLLDVLIVSVPTTAVLGLTAGTWTVGDVFAGLGLVWLFLAPDLVGIYAPLLMARGGRHNGQTLGKQALGIRVVVRTGGPMRAGTGFLREMVGKALLGFVPFYTFVDSLFPLWDDGRQAVHDKLAVTSVVHAGRMAE